MSAVGTVVMTPKQRADTGGVGVRDAPQTAPKRGSLDLRGVAVLIVEDDPDSLDFLDQMVGAFGATVLTARDGREAIELVSHTAPDLVLCDLLMPHVNGFQFMNWLRDQPHLSRIPVIAVTALSGQADIMRTWEAGFNAHLVKPIDYDTLRRQLERLLWAHHNPD
jgi:CheY-like chemotaxis protein